MIVERWRSRFHSPHPLPAQAVSDWHAQLAALDERALLSDLAGDDEWLFVDRLHLRANWRPDAGDVRAGLHDAMRAALRAALADPARVVRYANRRQAWADLLYRAALGDCARAWAWVGMGLLPAVMVRSAEPARVLAAAATGLALEPARVWPVLRRLLAAEAGHGAFTALLRALPEPGWRTLLAAAPATAPYLDAAPGPSAVVAADAHAPLTWEAASPADPAGLADLLAWIGHQPWLARRHAGVLAPLLAALTWRASGTSAARRVARRRQAHAFCHAAAQAAPPASRIRPRADDTGEAWGQAAPAGQSARRDGGGQAAAPATGPTGGARPRPATPVSSPGTVSRTDGAPPLPDLPAGEEWMDTGWAGVLFWLPRLQHDLAAPPVPEQALPALLGALATRLGVPPGDPVRRLLPGDASDKATPPALAARADALCAAWEAWLAEQAPDLPMPRLDHVCRRPGHLRVQPGWVEVVMPLDDVDTRIRRLGLDLDPGWLPWFGYALRYRYA